MKTLTLLWQEFIPTADGIINDPRGIPANGFIYDRRDTGQQNLVFVYSFIIVIGKVMEELEMYG